MGRELRGGKIGMFGTENASSEISSNTKLPEAQPAEAPSPAAAARTGAQVVGEVLAAEGVDHVFGLPGTTIMNLLDVLGQTDGIRYLSVRHEQAAAHMADGFWRASGRVAACLASRGPGAANMTIGVHNAYAESIPMLVLVGQIPDAIAYRDSFEELDLLALFRPLTKWAIEVHRPDRVGELLSRAIRTTTSGRPRPVLVSLPLDVIQAPTHAQPPLTTAARAVYPTPEPDDLVDATALLTRAQRPVLVLGGGTQAAEYRPEFHSLAEELRAPVVTTWLRKNAFPNSHPLFCGSLGYGAHAAAEAAVREADVLLALGCRFSEFATKRYTLINPNTKIIQVDVDADEIGAVYPVAAGIVADAAAAAASLCTSIRNFRFSRRPPFDIAVRERAVRLRQAYEAESALSPAPEDGEFVDSAAVIHGLREVLGQHPAILVQDVHSFGPWISRHLEFDRASTYFGAAGGSMGWGLPAALGVQAARPDERVIAVCGDGSFWMVAQDVETAVREDLPVVIVVMNNFSYGNTRDRQMNSHGGRYIGVFYKNPDFAAYARLLGAHGERVEKNSEFAPALRRALESGRTAIVDVIQSELEGLPPDLSPLPAR